MKPLHNSHPAGSRRRIDRSLFAALFLAIVFLAPLRPGQAANLPPVFNTEHQAQEHCPSDVVVWESVGDSISPSPAQFSWTERRRQSG